MDQLPLDTLIELLKQSLSKPDGVVTAAYITVGGMVGAAFLAALVQWLVTKAVLRSEHQKMNAQLEKDFRLRQFSQWQQEFIAIISELLAHTDPEVYPTPEKKIIVPLIHKAQLMLNVELEAHNKVNKLINELALAVNKWEPRTMKDVLGVHSRLLEASRAAVYLPGRHVAP